MKYLITGGCGFIGSHLCDALIERGHSVRILDDLSTGILDHLPESAELIIGDVTDLAIVKGAMQDMDGCFHLAAIASVERSNADWSGTHRINQLGTINVLDAARSCNHMPIPVVYASSAAVYGDNATIPLRESSVTRPISAYGADKLGSELHARVAWLNHQVPTIGLRFFNVYGPRQNPGSPYSGVISIFIDRILKGEIIQIFGDGTQTRDFIYVGDVVQHLLAAMLTTRSGSGVYNVCTGLPTSITQLAKTLSMVAGIEVQIEYKTPRKGDITMSLGAPDQAELQLKVSDKVALCDGLKFTLEAVKLRFLKTG